MKTRSFDDLIKEIEFEGERFIPIQRITALAFNYTEEAVKYKSQMWINEYYDSAAHYMFETRLLKPKSHQCNIVIWKDFNISKEHVCDNIKPSTNTGTPVSNQVEIVKMLIKWGFISK